jgi:mono/diheme cytochrome c family protein
MNLPFPVPRAVNLIAGFIFTSLLAACGSNSSNDDGNVATSGSDGPTTAEVPFVHQVGNATSGKQVFRSETFGNEGFWTDALKLQQGFVAAGVTPITALKLGLSVDVEALDAATQAAIAAELKTDLSPANAPLLNSPATTIKLINANAVIGIVAKDSNGDGVIDITKGDKTGASCAICHAITDASVFNLPNGGSIGKRLDGRTNHNLNFGTILATGLNSRAYYPVLQLALNANGGKTLGRAPTGLTPASTEADVDAYLSNPAFYPVGTFDDTPDGNGDPMHTAAFFRTDLAAPWGTEGGIAKLDNFGNLVYTALLDPTNLTTAGGRAFLVKLGGSAAGNEIVDGYIQVLAATGVKGYPYLQAAVSPVAGTEEAPLGIRVDNTKLIDMNAYLNSLQAPAGVVADAAAGARGRVLFRNNCTSCHNVDQGKAVPAFVVPMKTIFPGDNPVTLLAARVPPLNPIVDTPDNIFDDKMAVVNASQRGGVRGTAMPLLLDLARKPNFLHDNSVPTMDSLLNPTRGANAPHPFYFPDTAQRADMVEFLRGLDTNSR